MPPHSRVSSSSRYSPYSDSSVPSTPQRGSSSRETQERQLSSEDTSPPPPSHPETIQCLVEFRVGDPTKTCRAIKAIRDVYPQPPSIDFLALENSLSILQARVRSKASVFEQPDAPNRYTWTGEIFVKPFRWAGQSQNELLDDDEIAKTKIVNAWRHEYLRTNGGDAKVTLFVYLQPAQTTVPANAGGSSNTTGGGRVRGGRFQREMPATMQRAVDTFRSANEAGRPEDIFDPPNNASYLQAKAIDRQYATYRATSRIDRTTLPESATLEAEILGRLPIRINLDQLRRLLGVPDFSLRTAFDRRMSSPAHPPATPNNALDDDLNDYNQRRLTTEEDFAAATSDEDDEVLLRNHRPVRILRSLTLDSMDPDIDTGIEVDSFDTFPRFSVPPVTMDEPEPKPELGPSGDKKKKPSVQPTKELQGVRQQRKRRQQRGCLVEQDCAA